MVNQIRPSPKVSTKLNRKGKKISINQVLKTLQHQANKKEKILSSNKGNGSSFALHDQTVCSVWLHDIPK